MGSLGSLFTVVLLSWLASDQAGKHLNSVVQTLSVEWRGEDDSIAVTPGALLGSRQLGAAWMRPWNKLKGGDKSLNTDYVSSLLGKVLGQVAQGQGDLPPVTLDVAGCWGWIQEKWGRGS